MHPDLEFRLPMCAHCGPDTRNCGSRLHRLFDYWNRLRAGRRYPARADIDPLDLGPMLANVFLVDVLDGPRFRFRVTGTAVDEIHAQTLTGKEPRDIRTPEVAELVEAQYRTVLEEGTPRCDHLVLHGSDGSYWHYERLILPLSSDGAKIDMFLCGIHRGAAAF